MISKYKNIYVSNWDRLYPFYLRKLLAMFRKKLMLYHSKMLSLKWNNNERAMF
jgi:hypothetical protein